MTYRLALLAFLLFSALASPRAAHALQPTMYPGFRTMGVWQAEKKLHLDANIWYPSVRAPFTISYGPWIFNAARGGKELPGLFPLLILSHDSPGDRFSYHDTAAFLARRGFVVAALTHDEDNINNMSKPFTLQQLTTRAKQISGFISALLEHADMAHMIDEKRIGLIGFGAGGTAALMVGGAIPDGSGWKDYCAKTDENDPYCSAWAMNRMNIMARDLPMKTSLADPRVKAVAAVAPGFGMLFSDAAMRFFYPPLLLIRADRDTVNRTPHHADAILHHSPSSTLFATLPDTNAIDLMAECPKALKNDLPEICGDLPPEKRYRIHQQMYTLLADFFLNTLGDPDKIPQIPAPPVFAVEPQRATKPQTNSTKSTNTEKKRTRRVQPMEKPPVTTGGQ